MGSRISGSNYSSVMPWQTNDFRELEGSINQLANIVDQINRRWAQKWFENFQFVLGNQDLRWSRQWDFAFDADTLGQQAGMSKRQQTNYSRVVLESLSGHIYNQLPELYFDQKYESSSRGARLAHLLEAMKNAYDERMCLHEAFDMASVTFVLYSKTYACITWDKNQGGMFKRTKQAPTKVPKMTTTQSIDPITGENMIVPMPMMAADGKPVMIDAWEDVIGEDGKPVQETFKFGDANVEMLTPFEVRMDPNAKTFSKAKWIQRIRVMDYDDFMSEYSIQEGVIKDKIDKVQGGTIYSPAQSLAIRHFIRTTFSAPPSLDYGGRSTTSPMSLLKNKVFVVEHYDRPTEGHYKNPTPWLKEGRRTVLANGYLVLVSTPQYRTNKQDGWHPFVEAKWMPIPPSVEASGPFSDVVAKNREVNLTDTLMTMATSRQSGSMMLINNASGLDRSKITGEPGEIHEVAGDPSRAASYVADKNPIPAHVTNYRQILTDDIWLISGAKDSLRGEAGANATSGYMLKLEEERERKRLTRAGNNFEKFISSTYEKLYACIQQNAIKFDESVVAMIKRSTDGAVTDSDVVAFLNGPIDFGVDIGVSAGSMRTKSKATEQANAMEVMALPAAQQKVAADPLLFDEFLDFMDVKILRDISSIHKDRSRKENTEFMEFAKIRNPQMMQQAIADMPVVIWDDDDMIHLREHKADFIKNFDAYKRNPTIMSIYHQHCALHEQNLKAKQQMQDPSVAQQAAGMEQRAEQTAMAKQQMNSQPMGLAQAVQTFRDQKAAEQVAAMQGQGQMATTELGKAPQEAPQ